MAPAMSRVGAPAPKAHCLPLVSARPAPWRRTSRQWSASGLCATASGTHCRIASAMALCLNGHPTYRLPNTLSVSFVGRVGADVLAGLRWSCRVDRLGVPCGPRRAFARPCRHGRAGHGWYGCHPLQPGQGNHRCERSTPSSRVSLRLHRPDCVRPPLGVVSSPDEGRVRRLHLGNMDVDARLVRATVCTSARRESCRFLTEKTQWPSR